MAFDSLFTTNQIQIYKILVSYMSPSVQKDLVVYIKLMELQYAIAFFQQYPFATLHETEKGKTDTIAIFDDIVPFCDNTQREQILQLKKMMQDWEHLQDIMATFEMMKDLFPEGMGNFGNFGTDQTASGSGTNTFGFGGMDLSQLLQLFGGGELPPEFANIGDMMNLFRTMQGETSTDI